VKAFYFNFDLPFFSYFKSIIHISLIHDCLNWMKRFKSNWMNEWMNGRDTNLLYTNSKYSLVSWVSDIICVQICDILLTILSFSFSIINHASINLTIYLFTNFYYIQKVKVLLFHLMIDSRTHKNMIACFPH